MIAILCPVCRDRFAPHRVDKVLVTDDPFTIKFINKEAEKEYQELLDNDIKCPCLRCSI